jgi:membrane protein required for colicin V production
MSTFDSGILIVIGLSLGFSFFKGMIREIFSLLAYFTGYFCANRFNTEAAGYLKEFISNQTMANIVGFFLIFLGVSIVVKLIGKMFKGLMAASGMSTFDRLIGALLGVVKAVFFISMGVMILELFPDLDKKVTEGSKTAPYLRQSAALLKQNMFSKGNLNKGSQVLDNIKKKAESLKQLQELSQPSGSQSPQDNHTQLSKEQLESILKAAQQKK